MGISASVGTQIPTNVVEVGTEITQPSLDAISSAPSATSVNRFVVLNDLVGKANLAGAPFTGKISCTSVGGLAGINVGIGGTSTSATTAGDLWISTGGLQLNYRDGTGVWRAVVATALVNTFTTNQVIAGATTGALLRVNQTGTGNALVVEDATSPDGSAFVVDQFGKVGIGVAPDTSACLAVDATGIKFNDGTYQTTASQGVVGPAGPAGANATAWVYKGAYDNGYTYSVGDFVTADGSSYVMYNYIGGAGYYPSSFLGSWQIVASKGDQGLQGDTGPQGSQGDLGGSFPDAPQDGFIYARQNGSWVQILP